MFSLIVTILISGWYLSPFVLTKNTNVLNDTLLSNHSLKSIPETNSLMTLTLSNNNYINSMDLTNLIISENSSIDEQQLNSTNLKPLINKWKLYKNRYKILRILTNCSRDLMEISVTLDRAFHGLMYAKDFAHECHIKGIHDNNIILRLPTSGCGVRVETHGSDHTIELSVSVLLQIEEKLRQSSDILRTVYCKLPINEIGVTIPTTKEPNIRSTMRNGRMQSNDGNYNDKISNDQNNNLHKNNFNLETSDIINKNYTMQNTNKRNSSSTPHVRVWLELGGPDGSGSVEVGQATTLTVRAIVPGNMGVRIIDCAALDGLGESTQQLLDERGCPIDEQVMPALHMHFKPTEEGWSKSHDDDLVEKTYSATFPAFKFPDRERLHVSCGVQLCKGQCPEFNCKLDEKLILNNAKYLACIDIFNSLAVTAPQIEVDRLRYARYHNLSEDEDESSYTRPIVSDGTLCLSISKLAMSFCVLGLIFLAAIIISVFSLIRSRRPLYGHNYISALSANNSSRLYRTEFGTSMFSSSSESAQSTRFGRKLILPYYPSTSLPYGRVY